MKYLKFTLLVVFSTLIVSLSGCSQSKNASVANIAGNEPNSNYVLNTNLNEPKKFMTVKLISADEPNMTARVSLTNAYWQSLEQYSNNFKYFSQTYCLSNTEKIDETTTYSLDQDTMKLCFTVNDSKSQEIFTPLAAGTYYVSSNRNEMGRVSLFQINVTVKNQRAGGGLDLSHTYGTLIIENSTKSSISGKINLSDNRYSINGEFSCDLK